MNIDFGVLNTDAGRVVGFTEKPSIDYRVSMGVYGVSRDALDAYTPGLPLGFDELVLDLLQAGDAAAGVRVRRLLARHRPARRLRPGQRRVRRPPRHCCSRERERPVRILVLGATGFLGGHTVRQLRALSGVRVLVGARPAGRSRVRPDS